MLPWPANGFVKDSILLPNDQQLRYQPKRLTVKEAIEGCFKAKQAELKGDGKAGRWMSPLSTHIIPKIGDQAIEDLDQHMLKSVLEPIWHEKPDSARKGSESHQLNLLKHAAAMGWMSITSDHESSGSSRKTPTQDTAHPFPSVPGSPRFSYKMLCERQEISCLALRLLMLTVARTTEVRLARYDEIIKGVLDIIPQGRKMAKNIVYHSI